MTENKSNRTTDREHVDDWSNYWQGRHSTDAFVGVETNEFIRQHWHTFFMGKARNLKTIDLACGAGTVLLNADRAGLDDLTGLDYSQEAVDVLKKNLPLSKTIAASVLETGLGENSFDIVVSQFGLEYAGDAAFVEAARLLAPSGHLCVLSHIKPGGIYTEVCEKLEKIEHTERSNFFEGAQQLIKASFLARKNPSFTSEIKQKSAEFQRSSEAVLKAAHNNPNGFEAHLYGGFRQLFERQTSYDLQDIVGWLDSMAQEQQRFKGRMEAMKNAALDEAGKDLVVKNLLKAGLGKVVAEPFLAKNTPIAWSITARKE